MASTICSTLTQAERRILEVLRDLGTATRAEIVERAALPDSDADHSIDTLWSAGFVGCSTTFFSASGERSPEDWRYSVFPRGQAILDEL